MQLDLNKAKCVSQIRLRLKIMTEDYQTDQPWVAVNIMMDTFKEVIR